MDLIEYYKNCRSILRTTNIALLLNYKLAIIVESEEDNYSFLNFASAYIKNIDSIQAYISLYRSHSSGSHAYVFMPNVNSKSLAYRIVENCYERNIKIMTWAEFIKTQI